MSRPPRPVTRLATALLAAALALPLAAALAPRTVAAAATSAWDAEEIVLRLLNAERQAAGLVPVRRDLRLGRIARDRSLDMATKGYFSHTQPDGRTVFDILSDAEITWYWAGEIIAWNTWPTWATSAETAVEQWMESPGHRAIVLGRDFNYAGVGAAIDGSGRRLYTAVFIKGPDRTPGWVSAPTATRGAGSLTFRWTGGDRPLQVLTSGHRGFDAQVRIGSGTWQTRLRDSTATSLRLNAFPGVRYEVRVRERDLAGNVSPWGEPRSITY